MKFAMIVADSHRKVAIPLKLNLKLKSESEAKSHHAKTCSSHVHVENLITNGMSPGASFTNRMVCHNLRPVLNLSLDLVMLGHNFTCTNLLACLT